MIELRSKIRVRRPVLRLTFQRVTLPLRSLQNRSEPNFSGADGEAVEADAVPIDANPVSKVHSKRLTSGLSILELGMVVFLSGVVVFAIEGQVCTP